MFTDTQKDNKQNEVGKKKGPGASPNKEHPTNGRVLFSVMGCSAFDLYKYVNSKFTCHLIVTDPPWDLSKEGK